MGRRNEKIIYEFAVSVCPCGFPSFKAYFDLFKVLYRCNGVNFKLNHFKLKFRHDNIYG